jgi:hypothetical protein
MHMVGYFAGIASERGIAWRCSDSLALRDFLRLESREAVPDQRRTDNGETERTGGRQGLSLARRLEGPRRRGVEDAYRRTQAAGLFTLARRRQGPRGGLCHPIPKPRYRVERHAVRHHCRCGCCEHVPG